MGTFSIMENKAFLPNTLISLYDVFLKYSCIFKKTNKQKGQQAMLQNHAAFIKTIYQVSHPLK